MANDDRELFRDLTYEKFRALARDSTLSRYEKIGFPDSYRSGHEPAIFADIVTKLTNLSRPGQLVMDIGPGCSDLPRMLADHVGGSGGRLVFVDSDEMLEQLPATPFIRKVQGPFPQACQALMAEYEGRVNVIIAYSVLHHVFAEANPFDFLDRALALLAPGGEMLIGDIPNISKRKRFFDSAAGVAFHERHTGTADGPAVRFNTLEAGQIDDAVLMAVILRCRAAGLDAYLVPQGRHLPMANRREDLLVVRP